MNISFWSSPFFSIGSMIESALSNFVIPLSTAFSQALTAIALSGLTIWIGLYGAAMVRGESQSPIMGFSWRLVTKTVMIACACAGGIYQSSIVPAIQNGSLELVQIVLASVGAGSKGSCATNVSSMMQSLECFNQLAYQAVKVIPDFSDGLSFPMAFKEIIENSICFLLGGLAIALLTVVLGVEVLFCQVTTTLLLGLGPLFIVCGAFEPTKKYFDGWMNKLVYVALLNVLVFAFFGLVLSFMTALSDGLPAGGDPNLANAFMSSVGGVLKYTLALVCAMLMFFFLGLRLPSVAAAITGSQGGGSGLMSVVTGFAAAKLTNRTSSGGKDKDPNKNNSISQGSSAGASSAKSPTPSYQRAASYGRSRAARNQ